MTNGDTYSRDGWMRTQSQIMVNLMDPDPSSITIDDIAQGLSLICRFNGQICTFYSVAEHSVRVSELVDREWKLEALMHDAAEAYIQDIIRPLKYSKVFSEYKKLEAIWENMLAERFHLQWPFDPQIKAADMAIQEKERQEFKLYCTHLGMNNGQAKRYFMGAFVQYSNQRGLYDTYREQGIFEKTTYSPSFQ